MTPSATNDRGERQTDREIMQREIGIEVRVVVQHPAPLRSHIFNLLHKFPVPCGHYIRTTRCRFMMVKLRQWGPDDQIAALANAQAEIDVVERHAQIAVEAADLVEHRAARCQTRRCYR